ncbi:hypothetical protein C8R43DRAFT_985152 [Mycena crocata]|nr:hypothetical protein C8R43DRAFT_985152 [Mycena crocata]
MWSRRVFVAYRSFDERVVYPFPLTRRRSPADNHATYAESSKPLAFLFLDSRLETEDALIALLRPLAAKYKPYLNFVWMDTFRYSEHPQSLALQPKWPALVIQELNTQKQPSFVYDQSQEVGPVHVEDWIQLYIGGVLTPSLKSQPVPEVQNDNVYTLVSKEFDAVVFDDSEGYVYEFLRFLCGQCKRLAPTWEFLASHYAPLKKNLVMYDSHHTHTHLL